MAPKIEIKNYKSCQGREGEAFSCTLYVDGKKSAFVLDDGNGGMLRIDWTPTRKPGGSIWESPVKDRLAAYCATLGERTYPDGCGGTFSLEVDIELLINDAVNAMHEEKQLRKVCKTKTVFRHPEWAQGEFRTLNVKFAGNEAGLRAELVGKYGDKVEILNERFV